VALFVTSRLLSAAGVAHGFSLREGGDDRQRLRDAAGLKADIVTVHQVHGDRVVDARGREVLGGTDPHVYQVYTSYTEADAIVALDPGDAVGVRVADCVPILLHDPVRGVSAAVHSGWRGTRLSIAARAVRALQHAAGADPGRMLAAVGPSIGRCCYRVSPELAAGFRGIFGPEAAEDPATNSNPLLDLRYCVARTLVDAGLRPEAVEQVPGCTSCDIDAFFSHRRDKGRTGRHLAFIGAHQ
jgi:YfiH family protein